MKAVVILPTYNEKQNIKILIPQILGEFKKIKKHNMHILVVDDNSIDGTSGEVKKFMKQHKNIHLLMGEKKGLGVAYLRGFDYAINNLKMDVMIMMDADLSHPAALLPEFIEQIENGYDFVIGSRYVKGGDTPDWPMQRKLVSFTGNMFARIVAGLYSVHDCTSGYRALRCSSYKKIKVANLHTKGYAFMSTLLNEFFTINAKIKEIPLVFYDRKYGESKLKTKDMLEFFFNAFRLRFKNSKRMIKFSAVGGSGIIVNLGLFTLVKGALYNSLGKTNLTLGMSSLAGDELSIVYNFLLNHYWTFRGSTNDDHIIKKFLKFHLVALASVIINNSILFFLHNNFGVDELIAKIIGIAVAFIWNYFVNVKWTWREKI